MPAYCYNGQQVINIGDEVPVKIVKVREKAMTAQEAIEVLKSKLHDPVPKAAVTARNENEAINMAISALEKQLPAPPRWELEAYPHHMNEGVDAPFCPSCLHDLLDEHNDCANFCPHCGQAIDWARVECAEKVGR